MDEWELDDLACDFFKRFDEDFKRMFSYLKSESKNLRYIKEMEKYDFYHYDGYPNVYYFKVLNEEGVFELNMAAYLVRGYNLILESSDIGEIIRVSIDLNDIDDIEFCTMETINKSIMNLYDKLGYQATIVKKQ